MTKVRYSPFAEQQPEVGQTVKVVLNNRRPVAATFQRDEAGMFWQLASGHEVATSLSDRWKPREE